MKPSQELIEFFQKDRFATENGAYIEELDENYAKCSMKIEDRHRNALGAVMGGVYFTLADFALAVATNWKEPGTVSLRSDISYLRPVKGDVLTAEAICVKDGHTTGLYRVDVKDNLGNLTATANMTVYKTGGKK